MRDEQWEEIPDPGAVVVNTRGTVVTTAEIVILTEGAMETLDVRLIEATLED